MTVWQQPWPWPTQDLNRQRLTALSHQVGDVIFDHFLQVLHLWIFAKGHPITLVDAVPMNPNYLAVDGEPCFGIEQGLQNQQGLPRHHSVGRHVVRERDENAAPFHKGHVATVKLLLIGNGQRHVPWCRGPWLRRTR